MIHREDKSTVDKANNGLSKRLAKFFDDNPDEELTYDDIGTKFGATYSEVRNAVSYLTRSGVIQGVYLIRRKDPEAA